MKKSIRTHDSELTGVLKKRAFPLTRGQWTTDYLSLSLYKRLWWSSRYLFSFLSRFPVCCFFFCLFFFFFSHIYILFSLIFFVLKWWWPHLWIKKKERMKCEQTHTSRYKLFREGHDQFCATDWIVEGVCVCSFSISTKLKTKKKADKDKDIDWHGMISSMNMHKITPFFYLKMTVLMIIFKCLILTFFVSYVRIMN